MTARITHATPDVVGWRVGNSLTIESTRDAVEAWAEDADLTGCVDPDGLHLSPGDLNNMLAAMDDAAAQEAYDIRLEKLHERAVEFDS